MSTQSRADRTPEWDGVRVLLIFLVSWYHIWQQSWLTPVIGHTSLDFLVRAGYMPVDGTIFLSGFLLFLPYIQAQREGRPLPAARPFWRRRLCRILPSYLFVTLLTLFAIALPWHLYADAQEAFNDIFTHLTFSFTFFYRTYQASRLGAASWTIVIEMQMYLLFPLIARAAVKKPLPTLLCMAGAAWGFRAWCLWTQSGYAMVVNQLPNFLDVYALAMATALAYTAAKDAFAKSKRPWAWRTVGTLLAAAGIWGFIAVMRRQAGSNGMENLQANQMINRPLFALTMVGIVGGLPFAWLPVRKVFGNRLMTFLSGISLNYYLIHQTLAVHLKRLHIPYAESELPNQAGEQPWQTQYTALCFGLSVLLAIAITYLIEKPGGRLMRRAFDRHDRYLEKYPERRIL